MQTKNRKEPPDVPADPATNIAWRLAAVGLCAGSPLLLKRMRHEFERDGRLTPSTTTVMYAAYLTHAGLFAWSTRDRGRATLPWPLSSRTARALGVVASASGAALCVAGMGRFQGPSQVSGVDAGDLVETGAYRINRNPQYTGYVLLLAGSALATRSARGLALALGAAGAYAWWVPTEERALETTFKDRYRVYRARTRRWI